MAYSVIRSKLVAERITVTWVFSGDLAVQEGITSQVVTVDVLVGEDSSPEDLLFQVADTDGQVVTQQIQEGVPGVIYQLRCTVETDGGKTVEKLTKLAILPSPAIIPDIYGTRYTTKLYPLDLLEKFQHGFLPQSGRLRPMPFPFEYAQHGLAFVSGTLRDILIQFDAPDEYWQHGLSFVSGTLRDLLITYEMEPETIQHDLNFTSGTLRNLLITYDMRPEELQHGLQFISGTLT